jgi:hypothetical protein
MQIPLRELNASRTFLVQAHILVCAVRHVFFGAGDTDTAARLHDIATRLDDEQGHVERLIAKASQNGGGAS